MSYPPPPQPTPQQMQEIGQARLKFKRIRRAITSATFFGWSVLIFGGLSLLCSVFDFGVAGVFVGMGLCVIGYVELDHVAKLKKLDPAAPRVLGYNQFALAGLLVVYALWQMLFPAALPPEAAAQFDQVKDLFDIQAMERMLHIAVYGTLIAVALGVEVPMAFFYFRRTQMVKEFLATTPAWIIAMQQAGMGL